MSIDYQRRLPPNVPGEDGESDYVRPKEIVDADEALFAGMIRNAVVADTHRLPKHSGKGHPEFHEPHWGHTTGLLQSTLSIDRIEALPERFRVGLFAGRRSYPAVARPNFIQDRRAGLAASRIALKIQYPTPVPNVYAPSGTAHELDLLFAEGSPELNGFGHTFFLRDAREFAMLTTLMPPSLESLRTLMTPSSWAVLARVFKRLGAVRAHAASAYSRHTGWAGKSYYAAGPFALGDGAMKLSLRPRQPHTIEAIDPSAEPAHRQRAGMQAWIAAGKDAVFDLCVQVATPDCIPMPGPGDPSKSVMVAEYCDLQWDESKAPYVAVGTLTFHATAQSDLSQIFPWSPLQFNAWNTLPALRPLGQIFRARKHVHKAHSEARLQHIYDAEPGAMVDKAPFGGSTEPSRR